MAGLNPNAWTVCQNAQSRYQAYNVVANQSSATFKFDTGPVQNTVITGAEVSREQVSIDTYSGLGVGGSRHSVRATAPSGRTSVTGPTNYITGPFNPDPDRKSQRHGAQYPERLYALDRQLSRLHYFERRRSLRRNQHLRQEDVRFVSPTAEVAGSSGSWNYNLGALWKPIPITSLYWAYATASDPVGAELDGTSNNYGGLNPTYPATRSFLRSRAERRRSATNGSCLIATCLRRIALFRTDVSNARELPAGGYSDHPGRRLSRAGHRYGCSRQHHRQVEHLYRPGSDEDARGPFCNADQYRAAACLHRSAVIQRPHQISDQR